jgi:hypothetical protein
LWWHFDSPKTTETQRRNQIGNVCIHILLLVIMNERKDAL